MPTFYLIRLHSGSFDSSELLQKSLKHLDVPISSSLSHHCYLTR